MVRPRLDSELRRSAERRRSPSWATARADANALAAESERGGRRTGAAEVMEDKEAEYGAEARALRSPPNGTRPCVPCSWRGRSWSIASSRRARALLPRLARNEPYLATLASELTEALQFVDSRRRGGALFGRPRDRPCAMALARSAGGQGGSPNADVGTGFIVVGAEGAVVVDGRLETRIDRLASALAIEIHTRLQEELLAMALYLGDINARARGLRTHLLPTADLERLARATSLSRSRGSSAGSGTYDPMRRLPPRAWSVRSGDTPPARWPCWIAGAATIGERPWP